MISVKEVMPLNVYSCQMCFKDFVAEEQIIIPYYSPLCSNKCERKFERRIKEQMKFSIQKIDYSTNIKIDYSRGVLA